MADPVQTITAIFLGSKWSCLLLRVVLLDALSEVLNVYQRLKLNAFVGDIKLQFMSKVSKQCLRWWDSKG